MLFLEQHEERGPAQTSPIEIRGLQFGQVRIVAEKMDRVAREDFGSGFGPAKGVDPLPRVIPPQ